MKSNPSLALNTVLLGILYTFGGLKFACSFIAQKRGGKLEIRDSNKTDFLCISPENQ